MSWNRVEQTVRPPDPLDVEVLDRDTWRAGTLDAWRLFDGRCQGHVTFEHPPGVLHIVWRDRDRIRPTCT